MKVEFKKGRHIKGCDGEGGDGTTPFNTDTPNCIKCGKDVAKYGTCPEPGVCCDCCNNAVANGGLLKL